MLLKENFTIIESYSVVVIYCFCESNDAEHDTNIARYSIEHQYDTLTEKSTDHNNGYYPQYSVGEHGEENGSLLQWTSIA